MKLTGLHLLTTYQCTLECDHCFAWGSPWQSGTMTLEAVRSILDSAAALPEIDSIYFEGGEPFLYYSHLLEAVKMAAGRGYRVGIVSNGFWATSEEDALASLAPFAGMLQDLSISSDVFHWEEEHSEQSRRAQAAASHLDIPIGLISIAEPETDDVNSPVGQLPAGWSRVMYRGRAAEVLSPKAAGVPWSEHRACLAENLREPGRVHIDPLGHVHVCQGLSLGNLFETPLAEIAADYDPDRHPIVGPLLRGGPSELVRTYDLPHEDTYADECHMCDAARRALRTRFPDILTPDQMYGIF